jgi:hypothetical protein
MPIGPMMMMIGAEWSSDPMCPSQASFFIQRRSANGEIEITRNRDHNEQWLYHHGEPELDSGFALVRGMPQ